AAVRREGDTPDPLALAPEAVQLLLELQVPQAEGAVLVAAQRAAAVRREGDAQHPRRALGGKLAQAARHPGLQVPQAARPQTGADRPRGTLPAPPTHPGLF